MVDYVSPHEGELFRGGLGNVLIRPGLVRQNVLSDPRFGSENRQRCGLYRNGSKGGSLRSDDRIPHFVLDTEYLVGIIK